MIKNVVKYENIHYKIILVSDWIGIFLILNSKFDDLIND